MTKTLAITMVLLAAVASTAAAQTYGSQHAQSLILLGNGTDITHTLTLQAPTLTTTPSITLPAASLTFPASNAAGVLTNNGSGGLSWGSSFTNPMSALGDMIYGGASGTPTRLAATATADQILLSGSSAAPTWSTATYPVTAAAGTILAAGSSNAITASATPTLGASGGAGSLTISDASGHLATLNNANGANAQTFSFPTTGGTLATSGSLVVYGGSNATLAAGGTNLFNVSYNAASTAAVAGAVINSTTSATGAGAVNGLTVTASDGTSGAGTVTGISVSAANGATNTAIAVTGGNVNIAGLTASEPVVSDASKNLVSGQINLASSSYVTGILPLANGGTNANLTASNGGIFYSTNTAGAILAGTATADQILLSGSSAAPAWSTETFPTSTTINQLLYSSAANTVTGLATANYGVLNTSSGGVPSVTASPTISGTVQIGVASGQTNPATGAVAFANSSSTHLTTVQAGNATAAVTYTLPTADATVSGQVLTSNGSGTLSWTSGSTGISVISGESNGNFTDGTVAYPVGLGASSNATITLGTNEMIVTRAGTIKNLYIQVATTPGNNKDYEIIILKNGTASTVAADVTTGNTTAKDVTHTLSFAAGDLISVEMTHVIGAATNGKAIWAFELTYP